MRYYIRTTDAAWVQSGPGPSCVHEKVFSPDREGTRPGSDTIALSQAHVAFKPTVAQQRKCLNCSETMVDGELVVMYDVNREGEGWGTSGGYKQFSEASTAWAKDLFLVE